MAFRGDHAVHHSSCHRGNPELADWPLQPSSNFCCSSKYCNLFSEDSWASPGSCLFDRRMYFNIECYSKVSHDVINGRWNSSKVPNGLQRWANIREQTKCERNCWRYTKHNMIHRSASATEHFCHILLLKQPDSTRFSGFNNRRLKQESTEKKKYIACIILRIENLFYSRCIHYFS